MTAIASAGPIKMAPNVYTCATSGAYSVMMSVISGDQTFALDQPGVMAPLACIAKHVHEQVAELEAKVAECRLNQKVAEEGLEGFSRELAIAELDLCAQEAALSSAGQALDEARGNNGELATLDREVEALEQELVAIDGEVGRLDELEAAYEEQWREAKGRRRATYEQVDAAYDRREQIYERDERIVAASHQIDVTSCRFYRAAAQNDILRDRVKVAKEQVALAEEALAAAIRQCDMAKTRVKTAAEWLARVREIAPGGGDILAEGDERELEGVYQAFVKAHDEEMLAMFLYRRRLEAEMALDEEITAAEGEHAPIAQEVSDTVASRWSAAFFKVRELIDAARKRLVETSKQRLDVDDQAIAYLTPPEPAEAPAITWLRLEKAKDRAEEAAQRVWEAGGELSREEWGVAQTRLAEAKAALDEARTKKFIYRDEWQYNREGVLVEWEHSQAGEDTAAVVAYAEEDHNLVFTIKRGIDFKELKGNLDYLCSVREHYPEFHFLRAPNVESITSKMYQVRDKGKKISLLVLGGHGPGLKTVCSKYLYPSRITFGKPGGEGTKLLFPWNREFLKALQETADPRGCTVIVDACAAGRKEAPGYSLPQHIANALPGEGEVRASSTNIGVRRDFRFNSTRPAEVTFWDSHVLTIDDEPNPNYCKDSTVIFRNHTARGCVFS